MSLDIVQEVKDFKIKNLPEEQLRVRIGIHSGPCCAGKTKYFFLIFYYSFSDGVRGRYAGLEILF